MPIWEAASGAVLVGNGVKFESQLREAGVEVRTISPEKRHPVKDWLSEARIHQWSKNALIFVPLFLGRIVDDFHAVLKTSVGFLAFGLIASATYIINDLADLEADRAHATKRFRAIAAGRISVTSGFLASLFMLASGIGMALFLHPQFALVVSVYLGLTLTYTFRLKRDALLDVTVIGVLFTLRLVMGQALNGLAFSPWLLSFSTMFFVSLALAKRHVEAMRACSNGKDVIEGRGYLPDDWPLTLGYGLASASTSIVIMLLFLALEPRVTQLYRNPAWLYAAPLAVFIWLQRIWLLSHRMELHEDLYRLRAQRQDQLVHRRQHRVGVCDGYVEEGDYEYAMDTPITLSAPLVLLTGATGWLGGRVAAALTTGLPDAGLFAKGNFRVRALVPTGEDLSPLREQGLEIVTGDIREMQSVRAFVAGAEGAVLIHLAGIIHPKKVAEFEAINTQGTINLVTAAQRAGVQRAVIMSSNSPVGFNSHSDHRFTEESPYNPYAGYGRSKMLMEKALRAEMAVGSQMEIVIVRAPWFYGPDQPLRQTLFFKMIKDGKFPIVGSGRNRRSMAYTDNLAQGIILAAVHERAAGDIFWLADETPYTMNEIVEVVSMVLHEDFGMRVKPNTFRLPGIVSDVATIVDAILQYAGIYHQKIHVLSEMNKTIACDITKARKVLGYAPKIALREGMRRSVDWCLTNGQAF
ncbi:UbiA family prenyltransferase [Ensifer psoraleae]|uniref:UbiA family prenyltransferase n=1 Tax=Sinorhizobium psoraleae TaxID=520838 RepID=A0ABT4KQV1_9HYPH|nr:UbiA family prenyltransferase [Sinorhizobium psoraleae]